MQGESFCLYVLKSVTVLWKDKITLHIGLAEQRILECSIHQAQATSRLHPSSKAAVLLWERPHQQQQECTSSCTLPRRQVRTSYYPPGRGEDLLRASALLSDFNGGGEAGTK